MYGFLFSEFYYLFCYFLIAHVTKVIAYADDWPVPEPIGDPFPLDKCNEKCFEIKQCSLINFVFFSKTLINAFK